ncbi:unnamed protein product [Schistosoma margrebowiei]|uniref:Uncharacterized protein n=1 Tax=Schistosoma margrebowiei TaxID=48269 RepID=A0A183N020_9TREM|nr:unnamed protein product [Schistosoma margrebowiei]
MGKDSQKMGRKTRERIENENRDVDRSTNDGAWNSISDDTLKLSTTIKTTVLDALSKLGSHSSRSLNVTVVPKNSVGDWAHVDRVEKNQASQSKLNIPAVERKSTGDLVAQSTPNIVRPVIKELRIHKRASTPKQRRARPERTEKPGMTITVRDDCLIVMNFEDNSDLPLSLQDKNDRMLWGELNKKLGLPRIEPLTVTRLTRGKKSKHQNHLRLRRATLKNATDVDGVLLASHLLKSDGNDNEQIKEGLFGKIQLLDNQEVRLVVGDARFNLSCPRPLPIASCEVLLQDWQDSNPVLTLHGEQIDVVEKFVCLGSCISAGGGVSDETDSCIVKARAAYANSGPSLRLRGVSLAVTDRIYNASDVVLVNQDNPEVICLECIGHVEQTMAAVPDLETYVNLGK